MAEAAAVAEEAVKPQYGPAGDIYPVRAGEVWGIGPHAFFCGDLASSPLAATGRFIVVSDPPWGLSNLNAFQSRAGLPHRQSYEGFVHDFFGRCSGAAELNMEMGLAVEERVIEAAQQYGWALTERRAVSYRSGNQERPNVLLRFGGQPLGVDLAGYSRREFLRLILLDARLRGLATVLEPCLGLGGTLMAAADMGLTCIGSELHPRRLAHSLLRLYKHTGEEPRRLYAAN